jgi:hypothetical protein
MKCLAVIAHHGADVPRAYRTDVIEVGVTAHF